MHKVGRQIWLSRIDALNYGILEDTVNYWRKAKSVLRWEYQGQVHYLYSSLPARSRGKLPSEKELREQIALECQPSEAPEIARLAEKLAAFRDKQFPGFYHSIYKEAFGERKGQEYAKKHALWHKLLQCIDKHSYEQLYKAFNLIEPGTYQLSTFKVAVWKAKRDGLEKFVPHGNHGNTNARTTEELHRWGVKALASIGKAYAVPFIQKEINKVCKELGLKAVSESWVKHYLAQQEVAELVQESRRGSDFALKQRPYMVLEHAWFADDQWQLDGWTVPFYNEGKGNWERLTVCVVMDAHSGAWLGYSFDVSENGVMIWQAVEQAVKATGRLPYEIVSDNHSFNRTQETRNIKEQMALMGVEWTVTSNPRHKGQLERSFQTFGNKYCKPEDGYIGEGIRSRRKDAHPAPELRELYAKADHRPDQAGVKALMLDLIAQFNNEAEPNQQSRMQKYVASNKPHARPVDPIQAAYLFFKQTEIKISRYAVELRVRNQKYVYPLKENAHKQRWNNQRVVVRYDSSDLSEVYLSEPGTDRHICKLKQAVKVAGAKANQTDKDRLEFAKNAGRLKSYKCHLKNQVVEETNLVAEKHGEHVPLAMLNPATAPKEHYNSALDTTNREAVEGTYNPDLIKPKKPVNERMRTPYGRAVKQLQDKAERDRENPFKVKSTARPVNLAALGKED